MTTHGVVMRQSKQQQQQKKQYLSVTSTMNRKYAYTVMEARGPGGKASH